MAHVWGVDSIATEDTVYLFPCHCCLSPYFSILRATASLFLLNHIRQADKAQRRISKNTNRELPPSHFLAVQPLLHRETFPTVNCGFYCSTPLTCGRTENFSSQAQNTCLLIDRALSYFIMSNCVLIQGPHSRKWEKMKRLGIGVKLGRESVFRDFERYGRCL